MAVITALVVSRAPQPTFVLCMVLVIIVLVLLVVLLVVLLKIVPGTVSSPWRSAKALRARRRVIGCCLMTAMAVSLSGFYQLWAWSDGLPSAACEDNVRSGTFVVNGLPEELPGSFGSPVLLRIPVSAVNWPDSACENVIRLNAFIDGALVEHSLEVGTSLNLTGRVRRPWGRVNPAAREGERYALLRGVHGSFSAKSLSRIPASSGQLPSLTDFLDAMPLRIHRARQELSLKIRGRVSGAAKRFVPALVVGDRRFLRPTDWERLQLFGLSHLFVVSGLHISLVAGLAYGLSFLAFALMPVGFAIQRRGAFLGCIAAAWAYALIAGLSLPTVRAAVALSCFLLPRMLGRRTGPWDCFSLCLIALMMTQPISVLGASLWLSAGAVASLLWLSSWHTAVSRLRDLLRVQWQLSFLLIPLSSFWFGGGSLIGVAANLVLIPLTSTLVLPLLMMGQGIAVFSVSVGALVEWLPVLLLNAIDSAMIFWAPRLREVAFVEVRLDAAEVLVLLVAGLLLCAPPFPHRRIICALLVATAFLEVSASKRDQGSNAKIPMKIVVFDVGQGTSVLVSSQRESLLYDTGGGLGPTRSEFERAVQPFLKQAIDEINWLVVSHWDHDHAGGIASLRKRWIPRRERDSQGRSRGEVCRAGERAAFGHGTLQFMSSADPQDNSNDRSCVVRIEAFGRAILLSGDIGVKRERDLVAYWGEKLSADILLAGHHGSASSSSHLWLRVVDPAYFVVSAGRGNRFGHPNPRVLRRAALSGAEIHSTIDSGALIYQLWPDGEITCERSRHRYAPIWRKGVKKRDCSVPAPAG
ncbi:MAG: DNA internalization-related competence protein ComEC/Rec2 [Pseudomonadota bacterium]